MGATYTQVRAKILAAIKVKKFELDAANGHSGNANDFLDLVNALNSTSLADPPQNQQLTQQVAKNRQNLEANLSSEGAFFGPLIDDIVKTSAIGSRNSNVQDQLTDLYNYMFSVGDRVLSRQFTRGAFVGGSPLVGTGLVLRIATDANNLPMEASTPDVLTALVIGDATGYAPGGSRASFAGREIWRLRGLPCMGYLERGLTGRGSGFTGTFNAVNGDDSKLKNAAFAQTPAGGDATPTSIPGWNANVTINNTVCVVDRTNYYQEFQGEGGSPGALQLKSQVTFTQPLSGSNANANPIAPDETAPWHWSQALLPKVPTKTGAAGVLYYGPGSKTQAIVVQGMALTAADQGGAGNVNGTVQYVVTFVVNGTESMYGASASVTVTNHQVSLSNIPLGPAGTFGGVVYTTTARKVYRTTNGGATFKLLTTIADNTTTTYTDNTADGGLGAAVATANGSVWQVSKIEDANAPQNQWFQNWNQAGCGFVVSWNPTAASGPINVDRTLLLKYGMLPATIPGANGAGQPTTNPSTFILFLSAAPGIPAGPDLAWLLGDTGAITDTEVGSVAQDHVERAFQRYLPAANPAVNWADP
jgi:hypothetical protein